MFKRWLQFFMKKNSERFFSKKSFIVKHVKVHRQQVLWIIKFLYKFLITCNGRCRTNNKWISKTILDRLISTHLTYCYPSRHPSPSFCRNYYYCRRPDSRLTSARRSYRRFEDAARWSAIRRAWMDCRCHCWEWCRHSARSILSSNHLAVLFLQKARRYLYTFLFFFYWHRINIRLQSR